MLEKELQKGVVDVAHLLGYRVAHFRPAQTSKGWRTAVGADGAGWPDLCIVGRGRCLFVELKVGRNTLSSEQADWLEALRAAGQEAYVFTNRDWEEGIVEAVLARGTRHERESVAA